MTIHDFIGIGFGPAGIALAAAFDDLCEGVRPPCSDKVMFLEGRDTPGWQRGLLFRNTDIQHHYLRDLATPRDPRSRYTFANFLKVHDRLFEFGSLVYGGGGGAVSRIEWNDYVVWAARLLDAYVRYDCPVTRVEAVDDGARRLLRVSTPQGDFLARAVAYCAGQELHVPEVFRGLDTGRIIHATQFLDRIGDLPRLGAHRIAVVGAGQAAIEVTQHLHNTYPEARIFCVQRSVGFQHGNHSPFVQRMFHPRESDAHFRLAPRSRQQILQEVHRANYAAVDKEAVSALYRTLYEDSLLGQQRLHMMPGVEITEATAAPGKPLTLQTRDRFTGQAQALECDLAILATGFVQAKLPPVLQPLAPLLEFDELGHPVVGHDYALQPKADGLPAVYIPGMAEYSHGLGSSNSFSMLALKAERVARSAVEAGIVALGDPRTASAAAVRPLRAAAA